MNAQVSSSLLGYVAGAISLLIMWGLSWHFTNKIRPWALALGNNGQPSTSLLQFVLFTAITVFAYVTAFFAHIFSQNLQMPIDLPPIPLNLLILMGLTSATAVGSKQITLSWLAQGKVAPDKDDSTIAAGRDGDTELTKVQMTIWMFVAAAVYLAQFVSFMAKKEYAATGYTLPDIDATLLILMGASQGTYIAGKLVSRTSEPVIATVQPTKIAPDTEVRIGGIQFGETKQGNDLLVKFADNGAEDYVPSDRITGWTDTAILFKVPTKFPLTGREPKDKLSVSVRTGAGVSNAMELTT